MTPSIRVLLIDADEEHHAVATNVIVHEGRPARCRLDCVASVKEAVPALTGGDVDVVLINSALDGEAARTLLQLAARTDDPPGIVVVTRSSPDLEPGRTDRAAPGDATRDALQLHACLGQLERATAALREAMLDRDRLLDELNKVRRAEREARATLSHQLRNPLSPIVNCIALLRQSALPALSRELLELIEREVQQVLRVVDRGLNGSGDPSGSVSRTGRTALPARQSADERLDAAEPEGPPPRVLVVDDNHEAADTLAALLTLQGFLTEVCYDGRTAVEAASRVRPDAAIVDIALPVLDGHRVAQALRALPGGERLRLIALTGYGQMHDRERSRAAGFDAHVVKPVAFPVLKALLDDRPWAR